MKIDAPADDPKAFSEKPPFDEKQQDFPGLEAEMLEKPDFGQDSYKGAGLLEGKVALITGGDSGIGRAVAIAYAREGADVAISYLPEEEEDASETAKWIEKAKRKVLRLPGDIQQEAHCRAIVESVFKEFGKLDVLVNNAAFQMTRDSIEEIDSEEFDRAFRTNVYAMFYLCKAALPRMKKGGSIINTTSVQAYQPTAQLLPYASTKGAIVTFTKALAQFAIKDGIRVNAIAPGPVWTPLIPSTMPEEKVKEFGKTSILERPAQPAELAPAFVFLASQASSYITGSIMDLTGGKMLP